MDRTAEQIETEWLVMRAQGGDARAMERLVAIWNAPLLACAARLLAPGEPSRDATQQAWLSIVRSIGGLEDPARFRSWAFRILTNACHSERRARRKDRRIDQAAVDRAASARSRECADDADDRETRAALLAAFDALPTISRDALTLRYVADLSISEIASVLQIREGTVKSRLHEARSRLERSLSGACAATKGEPS